MSIRSYLFVGAHPDDIEINAGGTIAELCKQGNRVGAVVCSYSDGHVRGRESIKALGILGVARGDIHFLDLPEPNIGRDFGALVAGLERVVQATLPDTVVTHFFADTHQDHDAANKATMIAARFVPTVYMYCPTYPSGRSNTPPHPTLTSFFGEDSLQKKLMSIDQHESQKSKYSHRSWLTSLESIARADAWRHGGRHGCAELFQISRTTTF